MGSKRPQPNPYPRPMLTSSRRPTSPPPPKRYIVDPHNYNEPTQVYHPSIKPRDLNDFAVQCHADNYKWWHDSDGNKLVRNKGEMIALMHSELSECLEGERKDLMDDKLPHRKMAEVELVDTLIRIFDYAGAHNYDLQGAYEEKRAFNATRIDHSHAHRATANGKKF